MTKNRDRIPAAGACYSVPVRVELWVMESARSATVLGRDLELAEAPLIGDSVVVWDVRDGGGLYVVVRSRSWDSKTGRVHLRCDCDDKPSKAELLQRGWK